MEENSIEFITLETAVKELEETGLIQERKLFGALRDLMAYLAHEANLNRSYAQYESFDKSASKLITRLKFAMEEPLSVEVEAAEEDPLIQKECDNYLKGLTQSIQDAQAHLYASFDRFPRTIEAFSFLHDVVHQAEQYALQLWFPVPEMRVPDEGHLPLSRTSRRIIALLTMLLSATAVFLILYYS